MKKRKNLFFNKNGLIKYQIDRLIDELTFLLCKLVKEAGLPDPHISDDDVLEDIGVVVRSRGHLVGPPKQQLIGLS